MAAKATKLETAMILKYKDGVDKNGKDVIKKQSFSKVKTSEADQDIFDVAKEFETLQGIINMAKSLSMTFLNDKGKKSSITLNNVKEDVTEAEVKAAMDVILAKSIFTSGGLDLKSKDSAHIVERNSSSLAVK